MSVSLDHPTKNNATLGLGYIEANTLYTLPALSWRLNLGGSALRSCRRKGLIVRKIGRAKFILGSDLIEFILREGV